MAKPTKHKRKNKRYTLPQPGASPGLVYTDEHSLDSIIKIHSYKADFYKVFEGRYSTGFDVEKDLERICVVNQTTMLASDTQGIADYLKEVMIEHYNLNADTIAERFADTRDTLCYATNDNQSAIYGLLKEPADISIIVGGYNSSNTSHLVELTEPELPTYFINGCDKIISKNDTSIS